MYMFFCCRMIRVGVFCVGRRGFGFWLELEICLVVVYVLEFFFFCRFTVCGLVM